MCLAADIPLIESGTAGYLGQVTVIKKVACAHLCVLHWSCPLWGHHQADCCFSLCKVKVKMSPHFYPFFKQIKSGANGGLVLERFRCLFFISSVSFFCSSSTQMRFNSRCYGLVACDSWNSWLVSSKVFVTLYVMICNTYKYQFILYKT